MPLQTGTWTINISGYVDQLLITSVANGVVSGKLYGGNSDITGFWDEDSQRITFTVLHGIRTSPTQLFEGYMFSNSPPPLLIGVPALVIFTLSGYAEGLVLDATATRHVFGWYAQIGVD
jgi:hypothetical protein